MAKVSVRDALLRDLQERYPGEDFSTSDRILKLLSEVDTLRSLIGSGGVVSPFYQEDSTASTDDLASSMMDSLIGSVSVESP